MKKLILILTVVAGLATTGLLQAGMSGTTGPATPRERNVDGIMDNSFLIEEAYNQEPGVVQHILAIFYGVNRMHGPDDRDLDMVYTTEWPVFSQAHQFSYSIPYAFSRNEGQSDNGFGDILLNYRYQAFFDERTLSAFAPRISLVLPTGDVDLGLGDGTLGYQLNLPFSTAIGDRWYVHANAGMTWLPNAKPSPRRDLVHYNLGASVIYALTPDLHFLVECVGNWNENREGRDSSEREFAAIISPGVRKAFNFANESQLVLGVAAPIGLNGPAPDFGVFLYGSFE